jgi:hypothetical protein
LTPRDIARGYQYHQIIQLFGVVARWDGKTQIPPDPLPYGMTRISGQGGGRYYWCWTPGMPVGKDVSSNHDGSEVITECPFLNAADSNGMRPCALVGTNRQSYFDLHCTEAIPERLSYDDMMTFSQQYNKCSYIWVPE